MEITGDDVNREKNEDKAGYKSNDEESMNEDKTIEGEPDQQHEDELDVSNDTTVTKLLNKETLIEVTKGVNIVSEDVEIGGNDDTNITCPFPPNITYLSPLC